VTRRILTAREQVVMTAPWHRHAADRVDLRWERDGGSDWILWGCNPPRALSSLQGGH